ncbi:MAG: hypothetical protein GC159_01900 [Phycisphaera sp.]|nr:hypothetical protein [Phycisphaera sp.]
MSAPDHKELHDLTSAMLDDGLDDVGLARLDTLLRDAPDAQDYYLRIVCLHSVLGDDLCVDKRPIALEPRDAELHDVAPGPGVPPRGPASTGPIATFRPSFRYAAAAALVIAAGVAAALIWSSRPTATQTATEQTNAATLIGGDRAVWADDSGALQPGESLDAGPLHLRSGVAQIVMASGAVVDLVGDTTFRITGPNSGRLDAGRLYARVPHAAVGFAVATPHTTVTDLGTEFGLVVDPAADTQVHVFKGRVRLNSDRIAQDLPAGRATAVDGAGAIARTLTPDPTLFTPLRSYADRVLDTKPIGYWRFDESTGDAENLANPAAPARRVGVATTTGGPALGSGGNGADRSNRALRLDGTGYLRVGEFAGFDRADVFSLGAWVRTTGQTPRTIISKMDVGDTNRGYSLFIDANRFVWVSLWHDWARRETIEIRSVAPIPSQRWVHLLAAYDGSGKAAGVRLYVDGEPVALHAAVDHLTGSIVTDTPFAIGARLGAKADPPFVGDLDEAVVYDRALTPAEARQLYQAAPPAKETRP